MFNSMTAMMGRMSLSSTQRQSFDEINNIIESGTNDMLLQPDWDANMTCCDIVRNISDPAILNEIFMALKRKLTSKKPMTVFLALNLAETLVKNLGNQVYPFINEESFMKELAKVVKKYQPLIRNGGEERDVAELSADIVQAWGEAFMRRREYPNIAKVYLDLRREGIQFKTEVDQTKVPSFSPAAAEIEEVEGDDDGGLALAIQASLASSSTAGARPAGGSQDSTLPAMSAQELAAMIANSSLMLKDVICAFSSPREAQHNDVAEEVAQQLRDCLKAIEEVMGEEIEKRPESVDSIFKTCEGGNRVLGIFSDLKNGACTVAKASSLLSQTKIVHAPPSPAKEPSPVSSSVSELWHQGDLLDMDQKAATADFADFSAGPTAANPVADFGSSAPQQQPPPASRARSLSKLVTIAPPPREGAARRKMSNAPAPLIQPPSTGPLTAATPAFDFFTPAPEPAPAPAQADSSSLLLSAFDEPASQSSVGPATVAQSAPAPVDSILSMFDKPSAPPVGSPYGGYAATSPGMQPYGIFPSSSPYPAPMTAQGYNAAMSYGAPVAAVQPSPQATVAPYTGAAPLPVPPGSRAANSQQTTSAQNPFDLF